MSETLDNVDLAAWDVHRDALYRFVLRRVQDEAAAEDIVQDVFVKAWTRRDTLDDPSKLRAWLYQITRNAIIDHYRARTPSLAVPADVAEPEPNDDAERELAQCLLPLLAEVPEKYREALRLTEFEGKTQVEAAARLGISVSGAKSRVQRGRRLLRDVVLKCCRVAVDRRGHVMDYETRGGCGTCGDA